MNTSGVSATYSWQPQLFGDEATVSLSGCESKSITLRAGERWRLDHDQLQTIRSALRHSIGPSPHRNALARPS